MRSIALALSFAIAGSALAQNPASTPLVGVLRTNAHANNEPFATIFRDALAALGHVDGRNLRIEYRLAEGNVGRFPELAEALVRERAAVIVTLGEAATRAAQRATASTPIVAVADDLVAAGLIGSLAQPGGNTTGVSILAPELDAKRLEILWELLPGSVRFGLMTDPDGSTAARLQSIGDEARSLGIELVNVEVRSPAEFGSAIASLRERGVVAVNVLSSPLLSTFHQELGQALLAEKLPAICQFREMTETGCLASYGIKRSDMYVMLAAYTDKMLRGARPAETLARQPSAIELVINLGVARSLRMIVPPALLSRADEVIE